MHLPLIYKQSLPIRKHGKCVRLSVNVKRCNCSVIDGPPQKTENLQGYFRVYTRIVFGDKRKDSLSFYYYTHYMWYCQLGTVRNN